MREVVTPFKVGVVVIVGVAAFLYMFGQVREGIEDDAAGYRVYAIFRDVSGLVEKSRVVIAGIAVGQIDRIELVGDRARVWLLVNTPLKSDATVAKRQASLLGEYYLQLTPGVLGEPLDDNDEIKQVVYDVAPADILNEAKAIVENVKEITDSVRLVVSGQEGEQRLVEILENVKESVATINKAVAANGPKVDQVFDNVVSVTGEARRFTVEFRRDAKRILSQASAITAEVRSIVGRSRGDVRQGFEGIKGAVTRLQRVLDEMEGTLGRTHSIAEKIDEGEGSLGRLVNDDRLVEGMTEIVDESSRFIKQITRLQTIIDLTSEYYPAQAAVRNSFGLRLQPKPDKYYLLQLVDHPAGRTTVTQTTTRTTQPGGQPVIEQEEAVTEDRFRLTLQFAKRYYFATGRVGIFEDTGGIGLDLNFLDDKLQFTIDIFDFDRDVNPNLRTWASFTFLTHLFVSAGVEEALNTDATRFFIGGGVRFNDDDLKALLTAAPTPNF